MRDALMALLQMHVSPGSHVKLPLIPMHRGPDPPAYTLQSMSLLQNVYARDHNGVLA